MRLRFLTIRLRHPALASNGAVEHPTECDPIDRARTNPEPDDPARVLIHHDQDPVGPQRCRLTPEQIHAPEAVFHVAQESQPRGTTRVLSRQVVLGENPSNHVFVDLEVERQGDLLFVRFEDSPSWDYAASLRRPHG